MTDKKIIVSALVLSALLIGGAWYYSNTQPPSAAILPSVSPSGAVTETGILVGDPAAPVTMEEYSNFLCSACARFALLTLTEIKKDYISTGKVKMIIYIYPPYELGKAALCAQEQNKFTEYHDYVFNHQGQITGEKDLKDFAANAGLDSAKFDACYDSGKYNDKVAKWYEEGTQRGVDSTPTFFINGQKLVGAQDYDEFKKIIDQKLNQAL